MPMRLTPTGSVHKGSACGGVHLIVDDWAAFQPLRTGLTIALELRRLYPETWNVERYDALLGHRATWEGVKRGATWKTSDAHRTARTSRRSSANPANASRRPSAR